MQPKMAKYDSTVVLRKSPYNCISKLENKHMAYMSIDSNAKNIANTGSFVSQGNIHNLSSHLHQIPHHTSATLNIITSLHRAHLHQVWHSHRATERGVRNQEECDKGLLLLHDKSRWLLRRSAKQENRRRGGRASQATTHALHSFHCAHYTTGP